jgi:hypothetical protein
MTRAQLDRFVKLRNESEFFSNLQFQFDLETVGLKLADLGEARRVWDANGQANGYRWDTSAGTLREGPNNRMWID